MYAYHILLCALLVVSTAAEDKAVAEEDWNKLIEVASPLCKCSREPIQPTESVDCGNKTENILIDVSSLPKSQVDKVCAVIRDINNKYFHKNDSTGVNTTETSTTTENSTAISTTEKITTLNTTLNSTTEEISALNNTTEESSALNNTTEESSALNNATEESSALNNATEESITEKTTVKITTPQDNSTVINTTETSTILNNTTEKNITTNYTTERSALEANATERGTSEGITEAGNGTNTSTVFSTILTEYNHTTSDNTTTTQKPVNTSANPVTNSAASSQPVDEKEKYYRLSTVLITFFCSFGAGILIALASKMLYSRYRERTYGSARNGA